MEAKACKRGIESAEAEMERKREVEVETEIDRETGERQVLRNLGLNGP